MTVRYPRAVYPTPTRAEPESGENLTAGETSLSVCGRRLRCVEGGLAGATQAVAREFDQVVADHRDVDQRLELARLERRPEIGRASCRERVEIAVGGVSVR